MDMKFYTYAIYNKTRNKIYIGQTEDKEKRLLQHNKLLPTKKSGYTAKNSGLWVIIYNEEYQNRKDARAREKQLKTAKGREFIWSLIT
jgi:putative endonuclease